MNTSEKFKQLLGLSIPDHLHMVDDPQFANTGTIYIQPHDEFECVLEIGYSFQDRYCTFQITPMISGAYRADGASNAVYIKAPFEGLTKLIDDINKYLIGAM